MFKILIILLSCFLTCSTVFAAEFSADTVTEGFVSSTGKIYFKDSVNHRSDAMGMINITKDPFVYQLVSDTQKYTVEKLEDLRQKNPMSDFGNIQEMVKRNNLKEIGKEKIEGFQCIIYEGTVKVSGQQAAIPTKIWYSKKLGVPVKHEMILASPMGKVVSHINNIKLGRQDSSMFDIPEGYLKVNSIEEAMGMGSFSMPPMGGDGSHGPSEDDIKKMMEQMQKMMRKN